MRLINKFIVCVFSGMILSSCFTTQSVSIDQLEPGKVNLPAPIRKVALLSRNFKFLVDTLAGYSNIDFRLKKSSIGDNKLTDSVAVTKSLDQLRKILLESGRFDEVFVYPYNFIHPHIGGKEIPLSASFIQTLCRESETDAVISLEMLSCFYSRHRGSLGREISAEANVKVTAIWSVYTPQSDQLVDRYTHTEVIRWNEESPNHDSVKNKLPGRKEAISISCGEAAKNYSKRVVPHWTEASRMLMGLNTFEWDKAMSYALKNKWKEASQIWQKYTTSTQARVAGIAALDYAITQEMLGDLDQANFWSDKSVLLLKNGEAGRIARDYAAILYQRKLKAASLNSVLKSSQP
jgi:hypothetical protein